MPAAKKRRVASGAAPSPAFAIEAPADAPDWVRNSLGLLTREDLGPQWQSLVTAWFAREEQGEFVEQDLLPAKGRPPVVGEWIRRACSPTWKPTNIGDVGKLGRTFVAWWKSLQLKWRTANGTDTLDRGGDDWTCLRECSTGANGILSALAGLFFWGSETLTNSQRRSWDVAVNDALYVIEQLGSL